MKSITPKSAIKKTGIKIDNLAVHWSESFCEAESPNTVKGTIGGQTPYFSILNEGEAVVSFNRTVKTE